MYITTQYKYKHSKILADIPNATPIGRVGSYTNRLFNLPFVDYNNSN
jgi:hypothetical protein